MEEINTWPLIEQYLWYYEKYTKEYPKVAVMFQKGAHYNFFSTDDRPTNLDEIAIDMKFTKSFPNGENQYSGTAKNPHQIGFPIVAKSKYLDYFIMYEYTVVEVTEIKSKKGLQKGEFREVTNIYTKSTWIPETCTQDIHVVQIYVEYFKDKLYKPMVVGLASINLNTGVLDFCEAYNNSEDTNYAYDEIHRYICSHSPKDIFIYGDEKMGYTISKKSLKEGEIDVFLEKIYGITSKIDNFLGTEMKEYAKKALAFLLYYIYTHNRSLVKNLQKPIFWSLQKYMWLTNNAVEQLDITGNKKSLINLLDKTTTKIGNRMLNFRLLHPLTDSDEINKRYDAIESFTEDYTDLLKPIGDLEANIRLIEIQNISREKMYKFIQSLQKCLPFFHKKLSWITIPKEWKEYVKSIDVLTKTGFIEGYCEKFDKYVHEIESLEKDLQKIISRNPFALLNLKLEKLETGYYFKITDAKYKQLKLLAEKVECINVGKIKYIRFSGCSDISEKLLLLEEKLLSLEEKLFCKFVKSINLEICKKIANFIAEIDFYNSCKLISKHYCRPQICEGQGYINAVDMRHPIIEKITDSIYVPASLKIHKHKGILIYGVNSSGKSSIMKSLALNLVMAQSGMFVAAKSFKYTIYDCLQTRILGNDDMYNGHSSFAVEMLELKGIIAKSGPASIVFGDEICRGTETVSGTAIAASAIQHLLSTNTSFVFTTHLHEIVKIPEIYSLKNLGVFHMKIKNEKGVIIYKRLLEEGSGDTLYGLEIAEAMGLPADFIEKCHSIRQGLVGESILGKKSRYNKKVYIDRCVNCGEKAVDTHHIKPQKDAIDGFIDHYNMNNPGNLSGLCKKCHIAVTNGTLSLQKVESSIGTIYTK